MKNILKKYLGQITNHKFFLWGVVLVVGVIVFLGLLYANVGFLNITGYFERHDLYKNSIVLFFHDECSHCTRVDTYLLDNKVEQKLEFVKLDIFASDYNENELTHKARACGLDINEIGVPFLWDGLAKKCVIGYVDIIEFFRQKMIKKP